MKYINSCTWLISEKYNNWEFYYYFSLMIKIIIFFQKWNFYIDCMSNNMMLIKIDYFQNGEIKIVFYCTWIGL